MSMGYGMGGMDFMFTLFPLLFGIAFVTILAIILVTVVRGAGQWHKNNRSPVLTVEAAVVTKRADVSRHHGTNDTGTGHTSTSYYATFEVASGDRMELGIASSEYGMLVEGDRGKLTFQGTRYLGFERARSVESEG